MDIVDWLLSPIFLAHLQCYVPYLLTNVAVLFLFFEKSFKGIVGSLKRALAFASLYAMVMVLPMMWLFRTSGRFAYLFMIANVIYQAIYLQGRHKGKISDMLVPLTLANLISLLAMLLVPYLLGTPV